MRNVKSFETFQINEDKEYKPKFKIGDIVANTKHKTVGIVRIADDKGGEVKTDADGNVDVDTLVIYNKDKHKDFDIAPSTKKEIDKLNESNESINEAVTSLRDGVEREINSLIVRIKSGDGVDSRSMEEHTDGEILAMVLKPIIQGAAVETSDARGFWDEFNGGLSK